MCGLVAHDGPFMCLFKSIFINSLPGIDHNLEIGICRFSEIDMKLHRDDIHQFSLEHQIVCPTLIPYMVIGYNIPSGRNLEAIMIGSLSKSGWQQVRVAAGGRLP